MLSIDIASSSKNRFNAINFMITTITICINFSLCLLPHLNYVLSRNSIDRREGVQEHLQQRLRILHRAPLLVNDSKMTFQPIVFNFSFLPGVDWGRAGKYKSLNILISSMYLFNADNLSSIENIILSDNACLEIRILASFIFEI